MAFSINLNWIHYLEQKTGRSSSLARLSLILLAEELRVRLPSCFGSFLTSLYFYFNLRMASYCFGWEIHPDLGKNLGLGISDENNYFCPWGLSENWANSIGRWFFGCWRGRYPSTLSYQIFFHTKPFFFPKDNRLHQFIPKQICQTPFHKLKALNFCLFLVSTPKLRF